VSEAERDGPLKEVLLSTSAVVFIGCPHRATEHSTLADAVKSMASITLRVESNDVVLQELSGVNSVEVELGRNFPGVYHPNIQVSRNAGGRSGK
jgi:hypothetical protein